MSRRPRRTSSPDVAEVQQVLAAGRAEAAHPDVTPSPETPSPGTPLGPGHAPGHRHLGPPPDVPAPRTAEPGRPHDQPWVPKGGLVGRSRRSQRRG